MKIAVVFFIMFGLFVRSSGMAVKVLGTLDNNSLRITRLDSPGETITNSHSFNDIDGYNRSSEVPLSHTRRIIAGTTHEGILTGNSYFISFKNGTFQNFTLPCLSHELYDPVGLESGVVQLITCREESRVLAVKVDSQGSYTVMTRVISDEESTSSAAILTRNGASTAIYVSLDDNHLFYYSLAITGNETPYFFISLDPCSNWVALSLSDARVALHCMSSNQVYIFTGSNNGELIEPLVTVDNIVIVRNNDLAASIKDHGVDFFSNDFSITYTISIPVKRIDYVTIDDIPCFFLFHENGKMVYYLNSSNPLNDNSLELIVNETGGNLIDLNSFYMYLSSFVYFVPPSMVRVVDFINRTPYSTVLRPSAPFLIDIWMTEDEIITSTTTPSSSSSSLSSSGFFPTSTTRPTPPLPSTTFANSTVSTSTTTEPTNIHPSGGGDKGAIIGPVVGAICAFLVILFVIIFLAFILYNKKKGRPIRMPSFRLPLFPLSARSSPNSSVPDIATSVEATGDTQGQETGGGTISLVSIPLPFPPAAGTSSMSLLSIKQTVEATCTDVKETGLGTEDIAL